MKTIKKYESFIKEELNMGTYLSAAEKLRKKGHKNRAEKLTKYAKDKQEPVKISMYDKDYEITFDNFEIWADENNKILEIGIVLDKEKGDALSTGNYKEYWDNISSDEKKKFHDEIKRILKDEEWSEKSLKGEVLNDEYDEMSDYEKEFLEEYLSMTQDLIVIEADEKGFDTSGLRINDRRTALKLARLIKSWAEFKGGRFKDVFSKISVNDLYYD